MDGQMDEFYINVLVLTHCFHSTNSYTETLESYVKSITSILYSTDRLRITGESWSQSLLTPGMRQGTSWAGWMHCLKANTQTNSRSHSHSYLWAVSSSQLTESACLSEEPTQARGGNYVQKRFSQPASLKPELSSVRQHSANHFITKLLALEQSL